jgi:hypothetical protein
MNLTKVNHYLLSAMKPLIILSIICIMFSFGVESIKAQLPQRIKYQKAIGITSFPISNPDTTFGQLINSGSFRIRERVPFGKYIAGIPNLYNVPKRASVYDFANKTILSAGTWSSLVWGQKTMLGYRINTYDGIWFSFNMNDIPPSATSRNVYYLISKPIGFNDTFWASILRNSFLYFNQRK